MNHIICYVVLFGVILVYWGFGGKKSYATKPQNLQISPKQVCTLLLDNNLDIYNYIELKVN